MNRCTVSLILATYGRHDSVDKMLESISCQKYDLSKIEVIIVDQNDEISLDNLIKKYESIFKIIHIKSSIKGLAYNRNIGIDSAEGDIIAFPDDDCLYYPDTLSTVMDIFQKKDCDCLLGRIYDITTGNNIIRNWGEKTYRINWLNFYQSFSSITMFLKNDGQIIFDTDFGVGAKYGSCEDADLIVHLLNKKKYIEYNPSIIVWHPKENIEKIPTDKIYKYAIGFGAFCKKNLNLFILMLFSEVLMYHLLQGIKYFIFGEYEQFKKKIYYVKGRVYGFCDYK